METHWDILRACAELLDHIDQTRAGQLRAIADKLQKRHEDQWAKRRTTDSGESQPPKPSPKP